ncbi:unnamed protein product [Pleuronectes platessa]|uniref:Uncharacterized protein n=1 Tax=Pleuronectes platessa TaxID=8262 RepID=A0A9N7YQL9_PLEPL|nr:unnamed protein product [Pleuronectes platessa]
MIPCRRCLLRSLVHVQQYGLESRRRPCALCAWVSGCLPSVHAKEPGCTKDAMAPLLVARPPPSLSLGYSHSEQVAPVTLSGNDNRDATAECKGASEHRVSSNTVPSYFICSAMLRLESQMPLSPGRRAFGMAPGDCYHSSPSSLHHTISTFLPDPILPLILDLARRRPVRLGAELFLEQHLAQIEKSDFPDLRASVKDFEGTGSVPSPQQHAFVSLLTINVFTSTRGISFSDGFSVKRLF